MVAEVNQGGEMVRAMLQSIDANLPLTLVRASRGKFTRAEPVAALYEQGRVRHSGRFEKLEDQMTDFARWPVIRAFARQAGRARLGDHGTDDDGGE